MFAIARILADAIFTTESTKFTESFPSVFPHDPFSVDSVVNMNCTPETAA